MYFVIYNVVKKELYVSNGFMLKLIVSDWKYFKNGDIVKKKVDYLVFCWVNVEGKELYKMFFEMILIIYFYFYK